MSTSIDSDCFEWFGHADFDARAESRLGVACPIKDCKAKLVSVPYQRRELPFCPVHGLRLHRGTFVYWNGSRLQGEARLRNFPVRPDLARLIALESTDKAESHRLGYEMSEDALSWNVFVALAEARRLRDATKALTGFDPGAEPELYLWGERVDPGNGHRGRFPPFEQVRQRLESDIKKFKTEPDIMLVRDDQMVVCIEAKFGSGNTLAKEEDEAKGHKPLRRKKLLARYFDRAGASTQQAIDRAGIGDTFHSQLFRNVIFASEMARGGGWFVVNLVSATQWQARGSDKSYCDPGEFVRGYLRPDAQHRFAFRTWETLWREVVREDPQLQALDSYLRSKSAHYRPAFEI